MRAIAHAKVKTDKIDAAVVAKLHAAASCLKFGCRTANDAGEEPRPPRPARQPDPADQGEGFGIAGRAWLDTQPLALDEKLAIQRHLADLDSPRARKTASLAWQIFTGWVRENPDASILPGGQSNLQRAASSRPD